VEEYGTGACAKKRRYSIIRLRFAILDPQPDNDRVIDNEGFRPNVGIVICNHDDQVLWGRRINGRDSWQFPQGGVHRDESPEQAMYRELEEEVGLLPAAVTVLGRTSGWLRYRLPKRYVRKTESPVCVGQKQVWFLLRLVAPESEIRLDAHEDPEFDHWRWVSFWYPVTAVVDFKQEVYRQALTQLAARLSPPRKAARKRRRRR
jgi:putative (di)nucleoside polyphosphate hydrolase